MYWEKRAEYDIDLSVLSQPIQNWDDFYSLVFKCSMDPYTRYFQFRFIHNILPTTWCTNHFLYHVYRIGLKDSDTCTFCRTNQETGKHLMWECDVVREFWNNIQFNSIHTLLDPEGNSNTTCHYIQKYKQTRCTMR